MVDVPVAIVVGRLVFVDETPPFPPVPPGVVVGPVGVAVARVELELVKVVDGKLTVPFVVGYGATVDEEEGFEVLWDVNEV